MENGVGEGAPYIKKKQALVLETFFCPSNLVIEMLGITKKLRYDVLRTSLFVQRARCIMIMMY